MDRVAWMKGTNCKTYALMAGHRLNSTQHNPSWIPNSFSESPEILRIFWHPKLRHHVHKSPPLLLTLIQINSVKTPFPLLAERWHAPINAQVFQEVSFRQVFCPKTLYAPLFPHTCYMPRPSHSAWFDHWDNICNVKAIPLQAWTGPEGSRRLRHPDFNTIGTWRW